MVALEAFTVKQNEHSCSAMDDIEVGCAGGEKYATLAHFGASNKRILCTKVVALVLMGVVMTVMACAVFFSVTAHTNDDDVSSLLYNTNVARVAL